MHDSRPSSMPGSFDDKGEYMGDEFFDQRGFQRYREEQYDQQNRRRASNGDVDLSSDHDTDDRYQHESEDDDVYPEMFDDDLLATGEMLKVPY
jgi:NAD-dependent SIR2 family protein deacetylase